MKHSLFTSATVKLTAWYMALLFCVSLAFSAVLFSVSTAEFRHGLRAPDETTKGPGRLFREDSDAKVLREARFRELQENLAGRLVLFNIVVLAVGGFASYALALRTLQPIEQALEAQTRFSSDAAHELRTPLAVMQSEVEVALRDTKSTKSGLRQVLSSTLEEVHRLQTLTDRLLLLASNEKLQVSTVQLEDVVIDAVNRSIPLAQTKHMSIHNGVGAHAVYANEAALTDVVTILLDNAVKYSPQHSIITLTATATEKTVSLWVSDEGPGIKPSEAEKIFERFYRSDTSRSKLNTEGHGLGLSIAKRLVSELGGSIHVEPSSKKGATFVVSLRRSV